MVTNNPQLPRSRSTYQKEKLEASILFFLKKANNGHLGKTKLMKLLYYADFDHAEQYGDPITGARYRKLSQGPVPIEAMNLLDEMAAEGKINVDECPSGPYKQFRYEALEEPNLNVFSDSELAILEQVVARWRDEPLSRIVAATHDEMPWLSVSMNEEIPYQLAQYRKSLLI